MRSAIYFIACFFVTFLVTSCTQDVEEEVSTVNFQSDSVEVPSNDSVVITMSVDSEGAVTRGGRAIGGILYYKLPATRSPKITRQVGSLEEGRELLQGYFYPVEMNKRGGDKCIGRLFFKCTVFPRSLHITFENVFDGKVIVLHIFGNMEFLKSGKSFFTSTSLLASYLEKGCQYGPYEVYYKNGNWILGASGCIANDADGNSTELWRY